MPWVRIRKFLRPLRRLFHKDRNRFLNRVAGGAGFMARNGFRERSRHAFARRAQGGSYYDGVYERKRWPGRWRRPLASRDAESKRCG